MTREFFEMAMNRIKDLSAYNDGLSAFVYLQNNQCDCVWSDKKAKYSPCKGGIVIENDGKIKAFVPYESITFIDVTE